MWSKLEKSYKNGFFKLYDFFSGFGSVSFSCTFVNGQLKNHPCFVYMFFDIFFTFVGWVGIGDFAVSIFGITPLLRHWQYVAALPPLIFRPLHPLLPPPLRLRRCRYSRWAAARCIPRAPGPPLPLGTQGPPKKRKIRPPAENVLVLIVSGVPFFCCIFSALIFFGVGTPLPHQSPPPDTTRYRPDTGIMAISGGIWWYQAVSGARYRLIPTDVA